jgi:hypothetical protein
MKDISAANLIWLAVASLSRDDPKRTGFSHDEIRRRVNELEPHHGFPDATIRTHIATHCVANKKPDPGRHRKLYMNPDGSYRLYRPNDSCDLGRKNGKSVPDPNLIPPKYRDLIDWYRTRDTGPAPISIEGDPILALRGVGKELWKELGGGEKFIRELRENWYGATNPGKMSAPSKSGKKKKAV